MDLLQNDCDFYCQSRLDALPQEIKRFLELRDPQVLSFTKLMWSMQFYRAIARRLQWEAENPVSQTATIALAKGEAQ